MTILRILKIMRARLGTLTIEMLHQIGFIGNSIWNKLLEVIWKKFLMVLTNINSDGKLSEFYSYSRG